MVSLNPTATLTVEYLDSDGKSQTVTLLIGSPIPIRKGLNTTTPC